MAPGHLLEAALATGERIVDLGARPVEREQRLVEVRQAHGGRTLRRRASCQSFRREVRMPSFLARHQRVDELGMDGRLAAGQVDVLDAAARMHAQDGGDPSPGHRVAPVLLHAVLFGAEHTTLGAGVGQDGARAAPCAGRWGRSTASLLPEDRRRTGRWVMPRASGVDTRRTRNTGRDRSAVSFAIDGERRLPHLGQAAPARAGR